MSMGCVSDKQLRQMEAANTLLHRSPQFLSHDCLRAVLGQFEIVDTGHDTWKIVVGCERGLVRLAHHSQRWVQATETYKQLNTTVRRVMLILTTNRQFWTTCDELEIFASRRSIITSHDVDEVVDCTAFNVESMVSFQHLTQSCKR